MRKMTRREWLAAAAGPGGSPVWLEPVRGEALAFRTAGQKQQIRLSPLYQIFGERYTVCWNTAPQPA